MSDSALPSRFVLDGVPAIGYDKRLCPPMGALESVLSYLGLNPDFNQMMAVSGGAWRRFYQRDDGGNVALDYLGPGIYERACWAVGCGCRVISTEDREAMLTETQASLLAGRPVVASIGGPEGGVVAGWDHGGDTLLGWSYFQPAGEAYYACEGWRESLWGSPQVALIGDCCPPAEPRQVLRTSVALAVELAHTSHWPQQPDHVAGLAAYDAWSTGLLIAGDYPADDRQMLDIRAMVYGDQVCMVVDRQCGARYLAASLDLAPEAAEPLAEAARLYGEVAESRGLYPWPAMPQSDVVRAALADLETREGLARLVRQTRALEAKAVARLEEALALMPA